MCVKACCSANVRQFLQSLSCDAFAAGAPHSHVPVCAAPSECGLWLPHRPMPGPTEEAFPAGLWSDPAGTEPEEDRRCVTEELIKFLFHVTPNGKFCSFRWPVQQIKITCGHSEISFTIYWRFLMISKWTKDKLMRWLNSSAGLRWSQTPVQSSISDFTTGCRTWPSRRTHWGHKGE